MSSAHSQEKIDPIFKSVLVEASLERAFSVLTEHMSTWWPKSHHVGASAMVRCVVEPEVGGRWYEVGEDGSECLWGHVLVWEPPHRLVLDWQLDARFAYDPGLHTEVEFTLRAEGERRTRVELEHRYLERLGQAAAAAATAREMDGGWGAILGLYVGVAGASSPP